MKFDLNEIWEMELGCLSKTGNNLFLIWRDYERGKIHVEICSTNEQFLGKVSLSKTLS